MLLRRVEVGMSSEGEGRNAWWISEVESNLDVIRVR